MKKTLLTIVLTTVVVDALKSHLHNKKLTAQSQKREMLRQETSDFLALKRASFAMMQRERRGMYDTNIGPERMAEDFEFELIVAKL